MRLQPSLACVSPVLALSLLACQGGTAEPPADSGPPLPLNVEGTYAVSSPIDLTAAALAPEAAVKKLRLLRGLRDDPAGTFVQVLDEAGVPLAKNLYGAIPDPVESRVNGWINEAILARVNTGESLPQALDELVALSESTLLRFELLTDLTLTAGGTKAAHGIRGLKYDFLEGRLPVLVPRLVDKHTPVNAETEPTISVAIPAGPSDGALEVGDHAFGIPYGHYAWAAINAATTQRHGAALRPALGKLMDCAAMAALVSGKCVGPACVGHATELSAVCEGGLDQVVAKLQESVLAYDFNAVRFRKGRAQAWDASATAGMRDGRMDRIAEGTWEAFIDAGQGAREVRATFSGARR